MASHWNFKYYFGIMLPAICREWDLSTDAIPKLHDAFKEALDIESTSYLDDDQFISYLTNLHTLLVTEFKTLVPFIGEPDNVDSLTMADFIKLYKQMR